MKCFNLQKLLQPSWFILSLKAYEYKIKDKAKLQNVKTLTFFLSAARYLDGNILSLISYNESFMNISSNNMDKDSKYFKASSHLGIVYFSI